MELSQEEIELIEKYFEGELSEEEGNKIKQRILEDGQYRNAFEEHREFYWSIKALSLQPTLKQIHQKFQFETKNTIEENIVYVPLEKEAKTVSFNSKRFYLGMAATILIGLFGIIFIRNSKTEKIFSAYYQPETLAYLENFNDNQVSEIENKYSDGQYKQSLQEIEQNRSRSGSTHYENYLKGLNYLALKKEKLAIQYLTKASSTSNSSLRVHAKWYLGLAYLSNNERKKAKKVFESLVKENTNNSETEAYIDQVKEILKKI